MTEVVGSIFQQEVFSKDLEEKTGSTTKAAMGEKNMMQSAARKPACDNQAIREISKVTVVSATGILDAQR